MLYSLSSFIATVFLFSSFAKAVSFDTSVARRDAPGIHQPNLSAITVRSVLRSREEAFQPKHDCVHHYAEETPSLSGGRTRFAKTVTKYKLPALVLEDIETVLKDIRCSESSITVQFPDRKTLDDIRPIWDNTGVFFLISSHVGCNEDGERTPHLVTGILYDNQNATATFTTTRAEWREVYKTMTVKFGSSTSPFSPDSFRTHEGLRRRQNSVTSTAVAPSSSAQPTSSHITFDLASASKLIDPNKVLYTFNNQPNEIEQSATISCKDCTINGIIDIEEGEFNLTQELTPLGRVVDFYTDGYIKVSVNNLTAHIGLEAKLKLSTGTSFSKQLATIPIPGFGIPGIVRVGPEFRPVINAAIELKAELEFSYGFDIKVPDNSSITYNIEDIQNSTIKGFSDTTLTQRPFQATSPTITLGLSAGLRPELSLGIDFFGGSPGGSWGKIEAAVFLDLPSAKLTISTAPDLDENCKPVTTNIGQANPFKFPSLILVDIVVLLDVGVSAEGKLNIPNLVSIGTKTETVLTGTTLLETSTCLSFDASKKSLVKPTIPPTSTPSASGGILAEENKTGKKSNGNQARGDLASLWMGGAGLMTTLCIALCL